MNHLDEERWRTMAELELTPDEAEHLAGCAMCVARWSALTIPELLAALPDQLPLAEPPAELFQATVARFDAALATRSRVRRRVLLWLCAAANVLGAGTLAWFGWDSAWLLARLSVLVAQALAFGSVVRRLLGYFPVWSLVHLLGLGLSALLLALFWSRVCRSDLAQLAK